MNNLSLNLYTSFCRQVDALEKTRVKSDILFSKKYLAHKDINIIYSGLFIELVTIFERFIEDLFIQIATNDNAHPAANVKSKIQVKTKKTCSGIIKGDKLYVDWLPFDKTQKRALHFFSVGRPFSLISNLDANKLAQISTIRNSIAHKSPHSRQKLEKITKSINLKTQSPYLASLYLRHIYRSNPSQTYFEMHYLIIKSIAHQLIIK